MMVEKKHKLILIGLFVSLLLPISLLIYTYAFTESWSYSMGYNDIFELPVAITPDGTYLVAGNNDGKVCFFHRSSSTPLWTNNEVGCVRSVAISSNGDYIAVYSSFPSYVKKLYLFSSLNSTPIWEYSFSSYETYGQVAMSSDGNNISLASSNLYFFHKSSPTPLWNFTSIYGTISSVDMSSDGNSILAGQMYGGVVYFFNSSSSMPKWNYTYTDDMYSVALSSNGKFAAVGAYELLLFNTSNPTPNVPIWTYEIEGSEGYYPNLEVDISSKGNYITVSNTIHNPSTRQTDLIVYLFNNLNSTPTVPLWTDTIRADSSRDVTITPHGDFIFVVGSEMVYLYTKTSSKPIFQKDPRLPISQTTKSGAISADGTYLVVGGSLHIWLFNRNNPFIIEELLWVAIFSYVILATSSIGIIITYSIMKKRAPI